MELRHGAFAGAGLIGRLGQVAPVLGSRMFDCISLTALLRSKHDSADCSRFQLMWMLLSSKRRDRAYEVAIPR